MSRWFLARNYSHNRFTGYSIVEHTTNEGWDMPIEICRFHIYVEADNERTKKNAEHIIKMHNLEAKEGE